jgi:chorismate mutase
MMEEDKFEEIYQRVRSLYDEIVFKEQVNPMQVFGVFLGIIAQEFKDHATKAEFDEFLKKMMDVEWVDPGKMN